MFLPVINSKSRYRRCKTFILPIARIFSTFPSNDRSNSTLIAVSRPAAPNFVEQPVKPEILEVRFLATRFHFVIWEIEADHPHPTHEIR